MNKRTVILPKIERDKIDNDMVIKSFPLLIDNKEGSILIIKISSRDILEYLSPYHSIEAHPIRTGKKKFEWILKNKKELQS